MVMAEYKINYVSDNMLRYSNFIKELSTEWTHALQEGGGTGYRINEFIDMLKEAQERGAKYLQIEPHGGGDDALRLEVHFYSDIDVR